MSFSIGDKIMHPRFGAGTIAGETHRELVKGFEHYYVIDIVSTGATAYVPMGKMDELGVRPVMSRTKLAEVFTTLRSIPGKLPSDYKQRQAGVQEQLQLHRPIPVAEAVRDLTWHRERKHLTQKDEALLNQGRELLATEMALATGAQITDAHQTIDIALKVALADHPDAQEGWQEGDAVPTVTSETLVQQLLSGVAANQGISTSLAGAILDG